MAVYFESSCAILCREAGEEIIPELDKRDEKQRIPEPRALQSGKPCDEVNHRETEEEIDGAIGYCLKEHVPGVSHGFPVPFL